MIEGWMILGGFCMLVALIFPASPWPRLDLAFDVALAIAWGFGALRSFWRGNAADGLVAASFAGVHAYLAWRNRPRRNRLADRVLGVVRNLGHRLVVVPVGGKS